jgi:hypothetical protein
MSAVSTKPDDEPAPSEVTTEAELVAAVGWKKRILEQMRLDTKDAHLGDVLMAEWGGNEHKFKEASAMLAAPGSSFEARSATDNTAHMP